MHRTLAAQPGPDRVVLALAGALAVITVVGSRTWPIARHVITIVHEGGHALVAVCVGRRLAGIRLHSDTSGVTISSGRPTGPGVVCTIAAGYSAPAVLGLGAAALLSTGRTALLLQLFVALLLCVLIVIRNGFGVLSVLVSIAVVLVVSWFAPAGLKAAFAAYATWFLLVGGVRPVMEVARFRRRRSGGASDPDQLARLTGLPGGLWVGIFGLVALVALASGSALLVGVW